MLETVGWRRAESRSCPGKFYFWHNSTLETVVEEAVPLKLSAVFVGLPFLGILCLSLVIAAGLPLAFDVPVLVLEAWLTNFAVLAS